MEKLVPLVPLDSPDLKHGPYADADFQAGLVHHDDRQSLYGIIYRPERFTGDEDGMMGLSHAHPMPKPDRGQVSWRSLLFPYFQDRDAAVAFLVEHGYYGRVCCYVDRPQRMRGESYPLKCNPADAHETPVMLPWEAGDLVGITDIVNAPSATEVHGQVFNMFSPDMRVHVHPQGWVRRA